jgi:hypothetical protein
MEASLACSRPKGWPIGWRGLTGGQRYDKRSEPLARADYTSHLHEQNNLI